MGIERSTREGCLLALPFGKRVQNHLGTVHAAAMFALAEASSGEALLAAGGEREDVGGVVRKATCKYSAPARSTIHSTCETDAGEIGEAFAKAAERGRALVTVAIAIEDEEGATVGKFSFDWFLSRVEGKEE